MLLDNDIDVNNESMYAIPSTLSQSQQLLQSQLPINSASFIGKVSYISFVINWVSSHFVVN